MALDTNKLEKVKQAGSKILARCPACAEEGHDRKGEHLFIEPGGKFGCIGYPGAEGSQHRKRIFRLVGIRESRLNDFTVRSPKEPINTTTINGILGRLGRLSFTHAGKTPLSNIKDNRNHKESGPAVPAVPTPSTFTLEEERILKDIDQTDLDRISMIKNLFNGTVVRVTGKASNDLGKNHG